MRIARAHQTHLVHLTLMDVDQVCPEAGDTSQMRLSGRYGLRSCFGLFVCLLLSAISSSPVHHSRAFAPRVPAVVRLGIFDIRQTSYRVLVVYPDRSVQCSLDTVLWRLRDFLVSVKCLHAILGNISIDVVVLRIRPSGLHMSWHVEIMSRRLRLELLIVHRT